MIEIVELEDIFDRLGTPEAGRKLVRKARKEAPVRKVQSNGLSNVITRYCSRKMDRVVSAESRTVEYPAMVRYERDPAVLAYYPQPVCLEIFPQDRNGNPTRTQHTPDFLVIRKDGIWLEEWREEARLVKLAEKNPGRFVREDDGWHYPVVEDLLAPMGVSYALRSADEHPRQYIQNLEFLWDYLSADYPEPCAGFWRSLEGLFADRAAIHLRELLDADGTQADEVYKAIADGALAFDMINDDLSRTDRVLVFRDETAMAFHRKVGEAPAGVPAERLDHSIEIGGLVRYEDREYEIGLVSGERVMLQSGEGATELSLSLVEQLVRQGKLTIRPRRGTSIPVANALAIVNALPPRVVDLALRRGEWVERSYVSPDAVPRSERTMQRYRKAMREAGEAALDQHLALVPRFADRGNRKRRISEDMLDLIGKVVRESYNTPTNITKRAAYIRFVAACQEIGKLPCSERAFVKELTNLASTRLRGGKRMAYQEDRFVQFLKRTEPIHGVRPWQYVHIDHTELQILLRIPDSKDSIGRAWLSLAVDAESRSVLGFFLSFEAPSYRSCMMVLRDIVRRHGRMPETFVLDNGKEFHSRAMRRVCELYGSNIRYRPPAQPRFGSVMERLFGTSQSQLINLMEGNTQLLRHVRTVTKSVMPERFVNWTLPALHGALDFYFGEIYGRTSHPAHGDHPVEHLRDRMIETGVRRNRLVPYDQRFRVETCPSPVDGDTRMVDCQRGVKVNHILYRCHAFRNRALKGKAVDVRIDPWDVRYVYALIGDEWHQCASDLVGRLRDYTEIELRYAMAELAAKHNLRKRDLSPARIAEWMRVLEARNFDPRLRDQQAEARVIYDALEMSNVTIPADPIPPSIPDAEPATAPAIPKTRRKRRDPRRGTDHASEPITGTTTQITPIASAMEPERTFDDPYDLL